MPKYCSVPSCRNDSGNGNDRKSFYKFPLQDPTRLQQWLRNMGRENWTPSRHQYICHEHFAPSCFRVRWGIRYLESDAVPTVFQEAEKRKATDQSERKPKRLRTNTNPIVTESDYRTTPLDAAEARSELRMVHLYEIAVDPSRPGEGCFVESSDIGESDCSLQTDSLASADGVEAGVSFPLTLYQTVDGLTNSGENTELVVMSDCPAGDGQQELVNEITAAILRQGGRLVVNDSVLGCTHEAAAGSNGVQDVARAAAELSDDREGHETQVIAYFETIPNVLPCEASAQFSLSPDTVLSSALSSKPISSTLPIVSKHTPPSPPPSLVLTLERLDREGGEGDDSMSEVDDAEQQDHQLEEHCYHKNSLSKEQLEAIVAELQKKVKVLQQRHRRHLEKLIGLENTVSQLRQSNLLNEERLQLLERAYIQSSAPVPDAGETVAIIYEEDNAAYLYTPLNDAETML